MSLLVVHEDLGLALLLVLDGCCQGAEPTAQLISCRVDVGQDAVRARPALHLAGGIAGDPLGRLVPEGDDAIAVDEIEPLVEVVDDGLIRSALKFHALSSHAFDCREYVNSGRYRKGYAVAGGARLGGVCPAG